MPNSPIPGHIVLTADSRAPAAPAEAAIPAELILTTDQATSILCTSHGSATIRWIRDNWTSFINLGYSVEDMVYFAARRSGKAGVPLLSKILKHTQALLDKGFSRNDILKMSHGGADSIQTALETTVTTDRPGTASEEVGTKPPRSGRKRRQGNGSSSDNVEGLVFAAPLPATQVTGAAVPAANPASSPMPTPSLLASKKPRTSQDAAAASESAGATNSTGAGGSSGLTRPPLDGRPLPLQAIPFASTDFVAGSLQSTLKPPLNDEDYPISFAGLFSLTGDTTRPPLLSEGGVSHSKLIPPLPQASTQHADMFDDSWMFNVLRPEDPTAHSKEALTTKTPVPAADAKKTAGVICSTGAGGSSGLKKDPLLSDSARPPLGARPLTPPSPHWELPFLEYDNDECLSFMDGASPTLQSGGRGGSHSEHIPPLPQANTQHGNMFDDFWMFDEPPPEDPTAHSKEALTTKTPVPAADAKKTAGVICSTGAGGSGLPRPPMRSIATLSFFSPTAAATTTGSPSKSLSKNSGVEGNFSR